MAASFFLAGVLSGEGFLIRFFLEPLAKFFPGEESIDFARAIPLHFDLDSGGRMLQENAGRGLVDFLATASGAPDELFDQIVFENPKGSHAAFECLVFIR